MSYSLNEHTKFVQEAEIVSKERPSPDRYEKIDLDKIRVKSPHYTQKSKAPRFSNNAPDQHISPSSYTPMKHLGERQSENYSVKRQTGNYMTALIKQKSH